MSEKPAKRERKSRPFPASSFGEALELATAIQKYSSGQPIRRLTLFDQLGRSPDSGVSRQLVTNSGKYGLTKGSYSAEQLSLTTEGDIASDPDQSPREQTRAQVKLAIEGIAPFKGLFDRFVGNKLPARSVLIDAIRELGVPDEYAEEGVDTFTVNLKEVGLLQTLSGADRIIPVDHLLDGLGIRSAEARADTGLDASKASKRVETPAPVTDFSSTCFYVTAIGEEGSEQRRHSDLFLGSIVEPALEQFNFTVVRADNIEKPGMITRQIIDYLLRSRLVIADLSFHNPNVFYELAIRHALRLPTVQLIRFSDRIPFDVNQARTIVIDNSDIYTLVPKLSAYRASISNQVRRALDDSDAADNPITTFYPSFRANFEASQ